MTCEAYTKNMSRCQKAAVRPVEDKLGFCSWRCEAHGKRLKTYRLFAPWRPHDRP